MISLTSHSSSIRRTVLAAVLICLVATFVALVAAHNDLESQAPGSANAIATTTGAAANHRVAERFGMLPLSFERNAGQSNKSVKFLSRGPGYELFLTATDAVLKVQQRSTDTKVREGSVLRLKMIGANAAPKVDGEDELPGKVNYLSGSDPEEWCRNIPTYRRVHYKDIYPGIDVVYYGNSQRELEYDLVVAAGANPRMIRFSVEGAEGLRLDKDGNLLLKVNHGELSLKKPVIYQLNEAGERREIKGTYVIAGNEIRFRVQGFDSTKPLVIDPVLSYSTYLGAGGDDVAFGIAVDSQGSAYVTGRTDRSNFPTTTGAFKTTSQLGGVFVSKLDPTGSNLVYSTYLSGQVDGQSTGTSIAVDSTGNAHVAGYTSASDFPIVNGLRSRANIYKSTDGAATWNNNNSGLPGTVNAVAVAPSAPNIVYAGTPNGIYRSTDAGNTWVKAPLTGVSANTFVFSLGVDPTNASVVYAGVQNGNLFKTIDGGNTMSVVTTIPLNFNGVTSIKFDPSTTTTIYVSAGNGVFKSTNSGATWITINNFGIPGVPNVRALAIDSTAPLTLYAGTTSNGLFKTTNGGGTWTAMNNGMGGSSPTFVNAIVIDPSNPATIYTGHGSSGGINKSTNGGTSWSPVNNGVPSSAISAMVATASAVYASTSGSGIIKTTNGGTSWTNVNTGLGNLDIRALAGDTANLYAGTSESISLDAFVTKLNPSGSAVLFSTLLGGSSDELGNGVALDANGNIYVVGQTNSANFPTVNAIQSGPASPDNCGNGFVTKLNPSGPSYVFSTYLGGNGCDVANAVTTDAAGNAYVTGKTSSANFPLAGAFQAALGEPFSGDAFVTKFTGAGSLAYSTYLGGDGTDMGQSVAVDGSGNAYVTGITTSTNFPTVNPIQPTNGGAAGDVFVTKLNSQGSALVYSTYLGGADVDIGRGIAVDSTGNAYVTGFTSSAEFPVAPGALRTRSQIYKSLDGAANWSNDNYGLKVPAVNGVTQVAVDPSQPAIVYAGTGVGVFKSTDGGRTWSAINNGLNIPSVTALVIDPLTPSTIYVVTNNSITPNNDGVYKSTDGGNSWNLRRNGVVNTNIVSLAIDPVSPSTLYLGTFNGPVYKTTDGADNWAPAGNPSPTAALSIAVDPQNHATVYTADFVNTGGIQRSIDSGATWQAIGQGLTGSQVTFVAISPLTPNLLYASTLGGAFFKSVDGGANWTLVRPASGFGPGSVVFDPVNASTIYLLSFGEGLLKTVNGGQTWTLMSNGLNTSAAQALAINPLRPATLYLVTQPSSGNDAFVTKINPAGSALVYSTFIGGMSATGSSATPFATGFAIAIDTLGNAYVTGLTQSPNFAITPNSYQPFNRGAGDAFISKLATSYIIGGHVLDFLSNPVRDAEVLLNDGTKLTSITTDSDGSFVFSPLREGGTYTVSASKPHFTIAPTSQTFNNLNSDYVVNFTTTVSDAPFYTISGQVTENGVGLSGVTVTLSGAQSGLRTTDSNGNYSFELIAGASYTVTPSQLGFIFAPSSQTFTLTAPQTANFPATRQGFVVTNANNHGTGSLRQAIMNANATVGTDTITFNIPGPGMKTINLLTPLPEITDRVVIDATTQPGYAGTPLIELDGTIVGPGNGLVIKAGSSTVRGLSIGNFRSDVAIWLNGCDNNVIQGNYVGLAADGTTLRLNNIGILMSNSSNNLIGGTTAAARNVISGSRFEGIQIGGNNNTIQGNFIGTNAAGTAAIPNGASGVSIPNPPWTNNLIGGTAPGAGNLISGNPKGVAANGTGTIIQGNLIGTDVTGKSSVGNNTGVDARGLNILVGGVTPGARNIISGNNGDGISISGTGTKLQGNYIGTDITGASSLGNGGSGVVAGDNVLIGGLVPEARNIISANRGLGNVSLGSNNIGSAATVQGNYIGTDVTGSRSLSVSPYLFFPGVSISSNNNVLGGTVAGARNVISGNGAGIQLGELSSTVSGNVIQGNFIGLNAAGTGPVPNNWHGIFIVDAFNTTIGGTQNGAANKIAFNVGAGIFVANGTGNAIRGNSIFSNSSLGIDLEVGVVSGVTPNDPTDADTGPNNLQNFPVITSVLSTSNSTTIQGSFKSLANTTFQIDFYSNAALDPSGNGEGALFFNTTSVNTDSNGNATINATFPAALPTGRVITATATDPNGNTSEFSAGDATVATGSVQFRFDGMQVIEDVGMANITVLRTGGSLGTLTVEYSTSDDTAVAGQDYTATSGTLTFASGETSKTIQVPILDDATTEPDETFTVTLRNASTLEALGTPSVFTVVIQDRTAPLYLFLTNTQQVLEGDKGTTTAVFFTVHLSAATGRSVRADFATSNVTAFGGATCGTPGVDYENTPGTISFDPGVTSTTFPVKICGDTSAEADETFRVNILNAVNATISISDGQGTIINDDLLGLLLEEQGPAANQAVALDALLALRDPFSVVGIPERFATGPDRNTRVLLFARGLQLNPGEVASAVTVRLSGGSNNAFFQVPADDVRQIFEVPDALTARDSDFTQVKFRLPNNMLAGTYNVAIVVHGRISNIGTIRIVP